MRLRRPTPLLLGLALPGLLAAVPALSHPALAAAPVPAGPRAAVVVQGTAPGAAAAAVRAVGGAVTRDLPIVEGVAATVPAAAVPALQQTTGVRAVTPDATVRVSASDPTNESKPANPVVDREVGADELRARGLTGKGVRVALVDTGVADVADLRGATVRVTDPHGALAVRRGTVDCVDLSGEDSCADSYGHGTFMAGLIAGDGRASGGRFTGIAPDAEVVSIKIAGRDGSADVSKVLAAIQWAVSFKDAYGIRVLNLSLGTDSTVSARVDPLNFAVQRAWRSGLVVVVSASNRGPQARTISKPADDPLVLTVGAVDDRETPAISDDRLPLFSGRGPTAADGLAKPDVVAPGGRVIGLRAPGSTIEQQAPGGGIDATYRRGSGTSMSAAVVSGLAALLLQAEPTWTPDRVKHALMSTARKVAVDDRLAVGAGLVHGPAALAAAPGLANQGVTLLSDASGSIDGSRGTVRTTGECGDSTCTVEAGDSAQDKPGSEQFDAEQYRGAWTGSSWYSSQWVSPTGNSWYGSSWYGSSWYGSSWYGSSWYGSTDDTSYGASVAGSSWYGVWE